MLKLGWPQEGGKRQEKGVCPQIDADGERGKGGNEPSMDPDCHTNPGCADARRHLSLIFSNPNGESLV
jgi:hypothetical protein